MCAFSPVLGVRPSALIRYRVPGARYPRPGTRYQALVFEKPAHGVCMMQDRNGQDWITSTRTGTWPPCPILTFQILAI
jgi:hypothetical protein